METGCLIENDILYMKEKDIEKKFLKDTECQSIVRYWQLRYTDQISQLKISIIHWALFDKQMLTTLLVMPVVHFICCWAIKWNGTWNQ